MSGKAQQTSNTSYWRIFIRGFINICLLMSYLLAGNQYFYWSDIDKFKQMNNARKVFIALFSSKVFSMIWLMVEIGWQWVNIIRIGSRAIKSFGPQYANEIELPPSQFSMIEEELFHGSNTEMIFLRVSSRNFNLIWK